MPLLWLSLAFLCGIFAGWLLGGAIPAWLASAAVLGFFLLLTLHLLIRRRLPEPVFLRQVSRMWPQDRETLLPGFILPVLPLIGLLGLIRFQASLPNLTSGHLAWYNDQPGRYRVEGRIVQDPEFRDAYTLLVVEAERLYPPDEEMSQPVEGFLLARLPPGGDWQYGDRVRLEGRLRTPFETPEFSYRAYLSHRGIHTTLSCGYCPTCDEPLRGECALRIDRGVGNPLGEAVYSLRRKALAVVETLFPDPEAGLLAGILLGIETGIPTETLEAFRLTGTSHIIAISGFNFAIISGLLVAVFDRLLGRWRSLPAAWAGIGLYAVLAGASAGVVRAAIMGSLAVFAVRIGRRSSALNTLAFVAALMALFDPHVLWDVGFQLSFMATLGLMLYADPLSAWFTRFASRWLPQESAEKLAGPVGEFLLFTFAAQLTTLPLILFYFRQFSWISLLANPLVLPAQPPLMILGGLAALGGLIYLPFGRLMAVLAWPWTAYTIRLVERLAEIPGAAQTIAPLSGWAAAVFYLVLFSWTFGRQRLKAMLAKVSMEHSPRLGWALILGLALAALIVWQQVLRLPDGRLHLTMLRAGNGEALLIQTPTGRNLLINGGSSSNDLSAALGRRMPFGGRELDVVVVASTTEEQIAALPRFLEGFRLRSVLWAGEQNAGYSARELRKYLMNAHIPIIQAESGQTLDLGGGASLEVLAATRRGAVLLLEWQRLRVLLPLGLDFDSLEGLLQDRRQGAVTALLLADAGYAPLNPPEWIKRWSPQMALLSVAAGNADGLPHAETLSALNGLPLLRTDWHGWIRLTTDGEKLWVEVEKR